MKDKGNKARIEKDGSEGTAKKVDSFPASHFTKDQRKDAEKGLDMQNEPREPGEGVKPKG